MENHNGKPSELGFVVEVRRTQAQFSEMLNWMARGWYKLPPGRTCPDCGGVLWGKDEQGGRVERQRCSGCDWMQEYKVG